ncbi:hypothetical protein N7486_004563 [Penicillium sp. IBT 16267x]|nr:hypothetical protein N7486_004563 [Penicillium sp. IBT 16267x]
MSGTVDIKIGSSPDVHKVSTELLCEKSPYFAAMFTGDFMEKTNNAVTMQEIEGVVSVRSFSMLLEWVYLDRINDEPTQAEERISALIEFARFADMCLISEELFDLIERNLSLVILNSQSNSAQDDTSLDDTSLDASLDATSLHLHHVTKDHIGSAMRLPMGNPVRKLMVKACVGNFLGPTMFKFERETRDIDDFAADLLCTVRDTLKDATFANGEINYNDPFSLTRGILFRQRRTRYSYTRS